MKDSSKLISWSYSWERGMWLVSSLKKTWAKLVYSDGRETLCFAFSVTIVSLVAIVSLVMTEELGRKCL